MSCGEVDVGDGEGMHAETCQRIQGIHKGRLTCQNVLDNVGVVQLLQQRNLSDGIAWNTLGCNRTERECVCVCVCVRACVRACVCLRVPACFSLSLSLSLCVCV